MSATTEPATPELEQLQGPTAWGGGARRFFSLLWLIAVTDFKLTFLGTVLGYVWSLLRPLMLFAVLYVVFTKIFKFGVNLCLNLVVVFGFVLASGVDPLWTWLLFPLIVVGFVILASAVAMILSALYPRYRDVKQIWAVFGTVLFYGSPVLYPASLVFDAGFQIQLLLNPLAPLLEQANIWVLDPDGPEGLSVVDAAGSIWGWLGPGFVLVGLCAFAFWIFNRQAPRIAEEL
jgi:ABC-2 type transport system permease protein